MAENPPPQEDQQPHEPPVAGGVARVLQAVALLAQQPAHEDIVEVRLNAPHSSIRSLIGSGVINMTPITSLPHRFTVKSFENGHSVYLYSRLRDSSFHDPRSLMAHLLDAATADFESATQYLIDDGSLAFERDYINPDKVGFPYESCQDAYMVNRPLRQRVLSLFTPTVETTAAGKIITVNTFDDPVIASGRDVLRFISSQMPARAESLRLRQEAIWRSGQQVNVHFPPLTNREAYLPMMDRRFVTDHLTVVGAPSITLVEELYDLAAFSFRSHPISASTIATAANSNSLKSSCINHFMNIHQPSTFAQDISAFLKSLLAPGYFLLDIDMSFKNRAPNETLVASLLIKLICMFSETDMYSNITIETAKSINRVIGDTRIQQQRIAAVPEVNLFPFMNAFTVAEAEDPLAAIYTTVVPRKNYFIDTCTLGALTKADAASEAFNRSNAFKNIRVFMKELNVDKIARDVVGLIIRRLCRFFLDWNLIMRTAWYTNIRPGRISSTRPYDHYASDAHIHSISGDSMLYLLKVLGEDTLLSRSSTADNLRVEIGLTYEVTMAYYRYHLLLQIEREFALASVLTSGELYSLVLQNLPYLSSLYAILSARGEGENIKRLFNIRFTDPLFDPLFSDIYSFSNERLIRNGVLSSIIANEESFRITDLQIDDLINNHLPYRNLNPQEPMLNYERRQTLASLFDLARNRSFQFYRHNITTPTYISGFFPLSTASQPPPDDSIFPISFNNAHLVAQDFQRCVKVSPVTAYTIQFERKDFLFRDDYVAPSENRCRVSIPVAIHQDIIRTFDSFFIGEIETKVRQRIIAAGDFRYLDYFSLLRN